jgi:endonuclease/exonuclease/phosphatase family metal-dependent hydrolase
VTASVGNTNILTSAVVTALGGANYRLDLGAPGTLQGETSITITATDSASTPGVAVATFNYVTNLDDVGTNDDRYHTDAADASSAFVIDANNMFVFNDEDQRVRVYDRAISAFRFDPSGFGHSDLTSFLGLTDFGGGVPREVDFEASTVNGTAGYIMASHSNSAGGLIRPNRFRIVAVDITYANTLSSMLYVGHYNHFRTDVVAWDTGNSHGLGAGYFDLQASITNGLAPENLNGFNIEGLSFAPGSTTTAYVGFRAPLVPPVGGALPTRTHALIVPVTNFNTLAASVAGGTSGSTTFGAPIRLDLGGRGIRSIECNTEGCLIVAGPATASGSFQLYVWSGVAGEAPIAVTANLTNMRPEGIVELPTGPISSWNGQFVQFVNDNGDDLWYPGTSYSAIIAKDLPFAEIRKFRSDRVQLGVAVAPGTQRIRNIQGNAHLSAFDGAAVVNIPGVVTALRSNGFYMQDPDLSADDGLASSEGIFVFTGTGSTILTARTVGETVLVSGTVDEFRPGSAGLTVTEILNDNNIRRLTVSAWTCTGTCTITPTVLGTGGRAIPTSIITSQTGNVEAAGPYNAVNEGMGFMESLEGMLVQVNNALVVAPTNGFGEFWAVADNGVNATGLNARGGITVSAGDYNPERFQIDDGITGQASTPNVDTGAVITSPIIGVVHYSFDNYEVLPTQAYTFTPSTNPREVTALTATTADEVTIATYNVENLGGNARAEEIAERADQIVNHLLSPDIVLLQEVQDNNGATNDAVTAANTTLSAIVAAIVTAGGPTDYLFTQIDPVDDQDGGQPGGNIRVAVLYRSTRVTFIDTVGGTSTNNNAVVCGGGAPGLLYSPGRIDPTNTAFNSSRKPLAVQFFIAGERFFIVNNHFNSKGGDEPLYGFNQPPVLTSEVQRTQQATIVRDFVNQLLACDPTANVIIAGDLNDFQFSNPLLTVSGTVPAMNIMNLIFTEAERYGYNFQGNAQALDQVLVSTELFNNWNAEYDAVHINSEFFDQVSDHDPSIIRLTFNTPRVPGGEVPPGGGGRTVTVPTPSSAPIVLPATGYPPFTGAGGVVGIALLAGLGLLALGLAVVFKRRR